MYGRGKGCVKSIHEINKGNPYCALYKPYSLHNCGFYIKRENKNRKKTKKQRRISAGNGLHGKHDGIDTSL